MQEALLEIGIDQLMPDPGQPRKTFPPEEIERLAASIKARGVLQPLRVQWDEHRQVYQILTGESRWRAARIAGLTHVPCLVVDGQLSEIDTLADRLTENSVRHDLDPVDEAAAIAKLKALKGCNSKTLVDEYGFTAASITRMEALLRLPPEIQAMVGTGPGMVPPSAAYELSRLDDPQAQMELARAIADKRVSRDRAAEFVRARVRTRKSTRKASRLAMRSDGMSVSVSASEPLTWDGLLGAIERIRKEAKKLYEGGAPVTDLAKALKG